MMNPLPQITFAYRLLLAEQKHKDVSKIVTTEFVAFGADRRRFGDRNSIKKFSYTDKGDKSGNNNRENEGASGKRHVSAVYFAL